MNKTITRFAFATLLIAGVTGSSLSASAMSPAGVPLAPAKATASETAEVIKVGGRHGHRHHRRHRGHRNWHYGGWGWDGHGYYGGHCGYYKVKRWSNYHGRFIWRSVKRCGRYY